MNRILAALAILAFAPLVACQVPPASPGYNVVLTATAPVASGNWAGCTTSAPCTYAFYAETLATGTGSCDPTTSTNYHEITTPTARPSAPTFTDTVSTGLTRCYNVETVQATANSGPSNTAGPVAVPGIPLAPALTTPSTVIAAMDKPEPTASQPVLAKLTAPEELMARLER